MVKVRSATARGVTKLDWLDSRHTFSFGEFFDPAEMGFRALRVINEDWVQPERGFSMHSHRDMEIVTYVLEGALEHRDNLGNGSIILPGDIQRMSAGRGITHSEFNPSSTELVHFLQIWILPAREGIAPSYEQKKIDLAAARGQRYPIASKQEGSGSVKLRQDTTILLALLDPGQALHHHTSHDRHTWLQVARGSIKLDEYTLSAGDGAAADAKSEIQIHANRSSEILLFDLA